MAYSLYELQQVKRAALDNLYGRDPDYWDIMVAKSHIFAEMSLHDENEGYIIHPEDVAGFLMPILETNQRLIKHLGSSKLNQKYWTRYFCDYILDQYWQKFQSGTLPPIPQIVFPQPPQAIRPANQNTKKRLFSLKKKNGI